MRLVITPRAEEWSHGIPATVSIVAEDGTVQRSFLADLDALRASAASLNAAIADLEARR